jgi:uncharacterized protein YbjT (DUF2867 family)
MRIAIVGGTGTLGKHIATAARERGHEVRILSRSSPDYPVDLVSGSGLDAALAGCTSVVDASNATAAKRAAQVLVNGTARLLAAGERAGVSHHVCISIVGCDRVPLGYYRVKTEQEQAVERGPVPFTIVRATQFHELVDAALRTAGRYRVLPVPDARLQTVAAADVAGAVTDVVEAGPGGRVQVAGPAVSTARDLARTWLAVTSRTAVLLPVPVPGTLGRALRGGALTAGHADVLGTITFADWLAARQA